MTIVFKPVILPANIVGVRPGRLGLCHLRPVMFPGVGNRDLQFSAADAWEAMAIACHVDTGHQLTTVGAYRSEQGCIDILYSHYDRIYLPGRNVLTNTRIGPDGKKWYRKRKASPVAGFTDGIPDSKHAIGLANDTAIWVNLFDTALNKWRWQIVGITDARCKYLDEATGKFRTVWDWIVDEAESFGFSWEGAKPGKPGWEPWHLRYVAGDKTPARVLDMQAFFKAHA